MDRGAWRATVHGVTESDMTAPNIFTFKTIHLERTSLVAQMVKQLTAYNAGDLGSIPGLERSPGEGNGNSLQYSCLENPMDGGA